MWNCDDQHNSDLLLGVNTSMPVDMSWDMAGYDVSIFMMCYYSSLKTDERENH